MNDPHVVSLKYVVNSPGEVSYDGAQKLTHETDAFALVLDQDILLVTSKAHYASVDDARADIDPFLRAWELDVALRFGNAELLFEYDDAEIVDRSPPPPGTSQTINVSGIASVSVVGEATLQVTRGNYPSPPAFFVVSPEVETLWYRFEGYRRGHEPLLSMAYFCLTFVQGRLGGREKAAEMLNISPKLLSKLGELASTRGDETSARKSRGSASLSPLTGAEQNWVEEAVKLVIRRLGEIAAGSEPPKVTMADLPPL